MTASLLEWQESVAVKNQSRRVVQMEAVPTIPAKNKETQCFGTTRLPWAWRGQDEPNVGGRVTFASERTDLTERENITP